MLGFGALGQRAIGQIPATATFVLTSSVGAFALTGISANFKTTTVANGTSYSLNGVAATFSAILPSSTGAFALTGVASVFRTTIIASPALYTLTGNAAAFQAVLPSALGSVALTGTSALFRASLQSVPAAFALTANPTAPNPTGAYNLTGIAAAFQVQQPSSPAAISLAGIAGTFKTGLASSGTAYALASPSVTFRTSLAIVLSIPVDKAHIGFAALGQVAIGQGVDIDRSTSTFRAHGRSAFFKTTLVSFSGQYVVTLNSSFDGEIWRDRVLQPEIWTERLLSETPLSKIAQFTFSSLGQIPIGGGFDNERTDRWTPRRQQAEVWTTLNDTLG